MAQVDPAVASAAAANDGTAELAAATAAVLPFPEGPCAGVDEFLSVIGTERFLCRLKHAGRDGVVRASQTRVAAARSVLLDRVRARAAVARPSRGPLTIERARARDPLSRPQLGADDARVEDASRDLTSAARAALEGDGGVGIKNARFKMLVRMVPRREQKTLDLSYARARA